MRFKWFPSYSLDRTRGLTMREQGAYWTVLIFYYQFDCRLRDDEWLLAGAMQVSRAGWRKLRGVLIARGYLAVVDGYIELIDPPTEAIPEPRQPLSAATKRSVFNRDKGVCQHCGVELTTNDASLPTHYHCDHIVPVAKFGTNDLDNLAASCRRCNVTKGVTDLDEWRASR